jgi:hypothetical protein
MELNNVTYGNPTIEQKQSIDAPCLVDDLFVKLKENVCPLNDSEMVKDELNEIVDCLKSMDSEDNAIYLKRYKAYDRNLLQVINTTFKQKSIDVESLSKEILDDIKNLIYKLKYYYNRPRPNQLANYYKLKLFPYKSYSADTPSFPSGHTVEAYVILNVIANKYPSHYAFCKEIIEDIAYSRIYMGLHYPSDNDFAKTVGKEILKHKGFAKKYGI